MSESQPIRILIVDDEEELRENLYDLLQFKGYEVLACANGEEVVNQLETLNVDLALLDIQLPGIDGLEVLKHLKRRFPNLPVAMVSASSVRGVLAQAEEYGADRTILKPYTPQEMLDAIDELLPKANG